VNNLGILLARLVYYDLNVMAQACARRRELSGNGRMEWVTQLLKRDAQVITWPALLPTIKTYDLLPSFLAEIKTGLLTQ
jgi:hypothetical protein